MKLESPRLVNKRREVEFHLTPEAGPGTNETLARRDHLRPCGGVLQISQPVDRCHGATLCEQEVRHPRSSPGFGTPSVSGLWTSRLPLLSGAVIDRSGGGRYTNSCFRNINLRGAVGCRIRDPGYTFSFPPIGDALFRREFRGSNHRSCRVEFRSSRHRSARLLLLGRIPDTRIQVFPHERVMPFR